MESCRYVRGGGAVWCHLELCLLFCCSVRRQGGAVGSRERSGCGAHRTPPFGHLLVTQFPTNVRCGAPLVHCGVATVDRLSCDPLLVYPSQAGFSSCPTCDCNPRNPEVFVKVSPYLWWIRPLIRN